MLFSFSTHLERPSLVQQFSATLLQRSILDLTSRFILSIVEPTHTANKNNRSSNSGTAGGCSKGDCDQGVRACLLVQLLNEEVLVAASSPAANFCGLGSFIASSLPLSSNMQTPANAFPLQPAMKLLYRECDASGKDGGYE